MTPTPPGPPANRAQRGAAAGALKALAGTTPRPPRAGVASGSRTKALADIKALQRAANQSSPMLKALKTPPVRPIPLAKPGKVPNAPIPLAKSKPPTQNY